MDRSRLRQRAQRARQQIDRQLDKLLERGPFIKGAVYDDVIVLEARLIEASRVRLVIEYEVFRAKDGKQLAAGHTHHACTSEKLRPRGLPVPVYEAFLDALEPSIGEYPGRRPRQKDRSGE